MSDAAAGAQTHVSDWILVDQALVNAFAEATFDHQFVHVDPEAAAQTPFGGPIAHGFLTLSLFSAFAASALPPWSDPDADVAVSINYGFDRIRFLAPVRVGTRVRAHFTLAGDTRPAPDQVRRRYGVSVEVEGETKPAIAAEWIFLLVLTPRG